MNEIRDAEANAFAIALLLPRNELRQILRRTFPNGIDLIDGTDDNRVAELAKQLGVSTSMLWFRMGQIWEE